LFHAFYSALCAYANQFLKDLPASEEVVQEVMFRVWVNRENIVFKSSPKHYLFRAVRNGCLNLISHLESRTAYRDHQNQNALEWERSHEDTLIISELEQKIREAIDMLPMERKKVFILSRYEGLTYLQIASRLGISVKTVENQMSKALKYLREELADYLPWILLFFHNFFKEL
jgi:RNA polymerase sigma-70 factor (ECF subfamily)